MSVHHHLPDEALLRYASGECDAAESLLFACHLSLCATCRILTQELEAMGGELLRSTEPDARPSDALLEGVLNRLRDPAGAEPDPPPAPACPVLPPPLTRLVGSAEQLAWRRRVPGLDVFELPVAHCGVPLRLKRMPPGMEIPRHSHRGPELELVLSGGATDGVTGDRYARGDVAFNEPQVEHTLRIDTDGPCIALGMHAGRVRPRGLWSHLVFGWLGW